MILEQGYYGNIIPMGEECNMYLYMRDYSHSIFLNYRDKEDGVYDLLEFYNGGVHLHTFGKNKIDGVDLV